MLLIGLVQVAFSGAAVMDSASGAVTQLSTQVTRHRFVCSPVQGTIFSKKRVHSSHKFVSFFLKTTFFFSGCDLPHSEIRLVPNGRNSYWRRASTSTPGSQSSGHQCHTNPRVRVLFSTTALLYFRSDFTPFSLLCKAIVHFQLILLLLVSVQVWWRYRHSFRWCFWCLGHVRGFVVAHHLFQYDMDVDVVACYYNPDSPSG